MRGDSHRRRPRAIEPRVKRDRLLAHTPLGSGIEFDAIRRMLERWGPRARHIGDDAAVITTLGERALIVSTDTSVENVHFRREWLSPQEIGYRAVAAALSDVAAMGAEPLGILACLAFPKEWRSRLDALGDGIGEAAALARAPIIGGDMSRASELSLTISVLGTARDVLFRTSARPGDRIYMTGELGGSLAALEEFQAGRDPAPDHRARFAHPVPRIREAAWLAEQGAAAAIDVSDCLAADLGHLAAASRARITIDLGSIPKSRGVSAVDAVRSGEEYEIVVSSWKDIDQRAFRHEFNLDLTAIGVVEQGTPGVRFTLDGRQVEIPSGYLHFNE
ncbi:MAG TPA: thiamine-phosphate kinase [Gemmatimonadaceae bacterium]|nr:thiamine-phosphate kinase [Gemmatimonadaceae bacterium]